ncbi:hypothetical protein, partial [Thalassotalea profundi]|uniref:hypothetical protein n=1 Tax=Thalassotalea profundi TaxID=2036687 RepID=UPI001E3FA0BA
QSLGLTLPKLVLKKNMDVGVIIHTSRLKGQMKFPRFSGHLLITLRRLKCLSNPNLENLVSFKIKAFKISLKDNVMSKFVVLAFDIHPFMLSRCGKNTAKVNSLSL